MFSYKKDIKRENNTHSCERRLAEAWIAVFLQSNYEANKQLVDLPDFRPLSSQPNSNPFNLSNEKETTLSSAGLRERLNTAENQKML